MRLIVCIFWLFLLPLLLRGQESDTLIQGNVSFVSSKNVYVKFDNTSAISIGDTLFLKNKNSIEAALLIENKSSSSCVAKPLVDKPFKKQDAVFFKTKIEHKTEEKNKSEVDDTEPEPLAPVVKTPEEDAELRKKQRSQAAIIRAKERKQKVRTQVSAASYSNFSDSKNSTRLRYTFVMRGDHIKNSKFSTDNYIVYRHALDENTPLNEALKIYALSGKYDLTESTNITVGRRINPRISSLGVVDGVQFEKGFGKQVRVGLIGGSRPNFQDYSIDFSLMQGGIFFGLDSKDPTKLRQSTLAFLEQRNGSAIDRRFSYAQHSGQYGKINFFSSMEIDFYKKIQDEVHNVAQLTNLFLSLRYRLNNKFSLTGAYDNRKNTIFYESYKIYIDQLIDQETRQGMRLGFNYHPTKRINVGLNSSWRFQKSDLNVSKNLNGFLNYSNLFGLNANISLNANFLETNYISSQNYGFRLMKNFMKGKMGTELYVRSIQYTYKTEAAQKTNQQLFGASLNWRLYKNLNFSTFGEKTFDSNGNNFLRINTRLIQRF